MAIEVGDQEAFSFGTSESVSPKFLTVSQLTTRVKSLLESGIGEVWVKGELSACKPSAAGHLYFNLKDATAVLNCAMFRAKLKFQLQEGLEALVHGRISVYPPRGSYQLIVDQIEPVGQGALQLAFEQLKLKLQKEGLFDVLRKKPLPAHPEKIAIVTSPTGAALQDILNILHRRHAGISILVVPSLVQGNEAPAQLVHGVQIVNQYRLADVIIMARGGGSMEDLWCFNDETVVRAVACSQIPVISAVGHEVDFTLCDFAADLRAPTPSAAAELVSKSQLELIETLNMTEKRLTLTLSNRVHQLKAFLLKIENHLINPSEKLVIHRQWVDEGFLRMTHLIEKITMTYRQRFEALMGRLEVLSPLKVLGRGYTLIQDPVTLTLLKSVQQARSQLQVDLVFHDGKAQAKIL